MNATILPFRRPSSEQDQLGELISRAGDLLAGGLTERALDDWLARLATWEADRP